MKIIKRSHNVAVTGLLTVAVFVATLFGLNAASAVDLGVQEQNVLTASKAAACAETTLAVTVDGNKRLRVSNIQPTCYGRSMVAKVISTYAPSAVLVSGVVNNSTVTFTSSPAVDTVDSVQSVKIVIDGWAIPAQWTWVNTNPIVPNREYTGITVTTSWSQPNPSQFCANVTVTTSSASAIEWRADLVITGQPFNNDTVASHYTFPTGYGFVSTVAQNGRFVVRGTSAGTQFVSAAQSRQVQICNSQVPLFTGRSTSPSLTYSQTETTPVRQGTRWCKNVTVSVTGSPQFFIGWDAIVDITDLKTARPQGRTFTATNGSATLVSGNLYKVYGTINSNNGVKDGTPVTLAVCWT